MTATRQDAAATAAFRAAGILFLPIAQFIAYTLILTVAWLLFFIAWFR